MGWTREGAGKPRKKGDEPMMHVDVAQYVFSQLGPTSKNTLRTISQRAENGDPTAVLQALNVVRHLLPNQEVADAVLDYNGLYAQNVAGALMDLAASEALGQSRPDVMTDFGVEQVPTMERRDRERALDQLLDQYNATDDPSTRQLLEHKMRELRAALRRGLGR